MITCRELIDFLMDYLNGELPPEQRTPFEKHLAACLACRDYLQSYRDTIQIAKGACGGSAEPALPPIPEELVKAVLAARKAGG